MKEIKLTQGQVALVDDEDFERLAEYKWCAEWKPQRQVFVAVRHAAISNNKIYMHRQIMDAPPGMLVDHRNHKTLDNRRKNLRICTWSQNAANGRKQSHSSSRFKGVSWYKRFQKWRASIGKDGKDYNLGYFTDEEDAARAYNKAALAHFGEFALLNEVP